MSFRWGDQRPGVAPEISAVPARTPRAFRLHGCNTHDCFPVDCIASVKGSRSSPTDHFRSWRQTHDRQPPRPLWRLRPARRPRRHVHRPCLPEDRRVHGAGLRRLPRPGRPPGLPRLADHPGRADRRPRHPRRLLRPPRLGRPAAGPARRPGRPRPERLGVQRPERRLGVSGLPGRRGRGPRPDRRRRLRREAGHLPGRPAASLRPRLG